MSTDEAFETFVRENTPSLLRLAVLLVGDRDAAEETLQIALTRVFRKWESIREPDKRLAYTRRALTRTAVSWRIRLRARQHFPLTDPTVDRDEFAEVDDRLTLWPLVQRLPAKQRAVLVLRYAGDLSEREIAETLGVSQGTVKSHHSRAIAALRNRLGSDPTHKWPHAVQGRDGHARS